MNIEVLIEDLKYELECLKKISNFLGDFTYFESIEQIKRLVSEKINEIMDYIKELQYDLIIKRGMQR